jgi:hypothetical protein
MNKPTLLIRQIIGMAESVKSSADQRPVPAQVYHSALLLQRLQRSGLTFRARPLLTVRSNGRLIAEYTPDFIVHDGKNGEAVVICLIVSLQTKRKDVERAQACLDAYRENASGLLVNFGGERLSWSLLAQNQRRFYAHRRENYG